MYMFIQMHFFNLSFRTFQIFLFTNKVSKLKMDFNQLFNYLHIDFHILYYHFYHFIICYGKEVGPQQNALRRTLA